MGVQPVTYYTAVCDHCGGDMLDGDDYQAWSDDGHVIDVVRDSDDTVIDDRDGTILMFCNSCVYDYWKALDGDDWDALYEGEAEAVDKLKAWLAANPRKAAESA